MRSLLFSLNRSHFKWDTFRSGGNGGQNQNKRDTGVRCTHEPSGAVGEARDGRTQWVNKKSAFKRCVESDKFQAWVRIKALDMPPIDALVDALMEPQNILVEQRIDGKWVKQ